MTDKAIFRVNHPTGSYEIVVSEFFGTADKTKIKKLLRIAAQHCTEAQQAVLLRDLTTEHDRCVKALDKLDVLIAEQQQWFLTSSVWHSIAVLTFSMARFGLLQGEGIS